MKKGLILIVDDSLETKSLLKAYFDNDYELLFADNGSDGLKLIQNRTDIDLVLLDLFMPVMDGFEFLEKFSLLNLHDKLPIIILSASESKKDEIKCFNLGATDFVSKPFEPEIIKKKVELCIILYKRMTELQISDANIFNDVNDIIIIADAITNKMVFANQAAKKNLPADFLTSDIPCYKSEERRVGKECR